MIVNDSSNLWEPETNNKDLTRKYGFLGSNEVIDLDGIPIMPSTCKVNVGLQRESRHVIHNDYVQVIACLKDCIFVSIYLYYP